MIEDRTERSQFIKDQIPSWQDLLKKTGLFKDRQIAGLIVFKALLLVGHLKSGDQPKQNHNFASKLAPDPPPARSEPLIAYWAARKYTLQDTDPKRQDYWRSFTDIWKATKYLAADGKSILGGFWGYSDPDMRKDWGEPRIREQLLSYKNWYDLMKRKEESADKEIEFPTKPEDSYEAVIEQHNQDSTPLTPDQELQKELQIVQLQNFKDESFGKLGFYPHELAMLISLRKGLQDGLVPFTDFPNGLPEDPNNQPNSKLYPGGVNLTPGARKHPQIMRRRDRSELFKGLVRWQVNQILETNLNLYGPLEPSLEEKVTQWKNNIKNPTLDTTSSGGDFEFWGRIDMLRDQLPHEPQIVTIAEPESPVAEGASLEESNRLKRLGQAVERGERDEFVEPRIEFELLPGNEESQAAVQGALELLEIISKGEQITIDEELLKIPEEEDPIRNRLLFEKREFWRDKNPEAK